MSNNGQNQQRHSGAGMGFLAILVAIVFIVGPFAAPFKIAWLSQVILVGFGVLLLTGGSIIVVVTRLYRKTAANEAFVKTGMGGRKAIIDGGGLVIPVVHELVWVSLETMKITVSKLNKESLLTLDKLRADIKAEFYIRVDRKPEGVLQASSTMGSRCSNPDEVKRLLEEKLVSALRVVAAQTNLEDLNKERDKFADAVQTIVRKDIEHNGYVLETVTISHLDQAPPTALDPESNVFDAEGARRIAEITSKAKVERNSLVVVAEQQVKKQNVEKDKYLYEREVERATAEALKNQKIAEAQATATAEAAKVQAEQSRVSQTADVEREKQVEVARTLKQQAIDVASQQREQATRIAEVTRLQAEEIAEREKQIAVAEAEERRALAEQKRLTAEKAKETEAQAVTTVQVQATAERDKTKKVIEKEAEAAQTKISREMEADVAAYAQIKAAEAAQRAAEANAAARLTKATAEKDALTLEAEGKKAGELIPVQVKAADQEVEKVRVLVLKQELEAKTANSAIAAELEKALAQIIAEKEARIAMAEAFGQAMAAAKITIWGDPMTLRRMSESFFNGQSNGRYVEGLDASLPPDVKDLALASVSGLGQMGAAIIKKFTGVSVEPEIVERIARETIREESKSAAVGTTSSASASN